jgi:hypothetical protein
MSASPEANTTGSNHRVPPHPNIPQPLPDRSPDTRVETLRPPRTFGVDVNQSAAVPDGFSMFDLNELPNFFEWDIDAMPTSTGFEDISAFGFMNQYGTM